MCLSLRKGNSKMSTARKASKTGQLEGLIHATNGFSEELIFNQLFLQ